jgi:hypothetical protein
MDDALEHVAESKAPITRAVVGEHLFDLDPMVGEP